CSLSRSCVLLILRPPTSTLFPYTTLFRSNHVDKSGMTLWATGRTTGDRGALWATRRSVHALCAACPRLAQRFSAGLSLVRKASAAGRCTSYPQQERAPRNIINTVF